VAIFSPDSGVNEREPTLIPDGALQDVEGAEYRIGETGLFVARGRDEIGRISGFTGRGLYEAGFDGSAGYIVVHEGNSLHAGLIASGVTFSLITSLPSGTSQVVGSHYANRQYLAFGTANRRLELSGGDVLAFPVGMSRSTFGIGVSITQGSGTMSATTRLVYWTTEYDSARGIESMTGASVSTGAFSDRDSVIATVTGVSANSRANQIRWYRSADGGGFPDAGLIATTAIGTTQITDAQTATGSLTIPQYGIISVGGLDTERDNPPSPLHMIFGPFQDSLLGVDPNDPRVLLFTPAG